MEPELGCLVDKSTAHLHISASLYFMQSDTLEASLIGKKKKNNSPVYFSTTCWPIHHDEADVLYNHAGLLHVFCLL